MTVRLPAGSSVALNAAPVELDRLFGTTRLDQRLRQSGQRRRVVGVDAHRPAQDVGGLVAGTDPEAELGDETVMSRVVGGSRKQLAADSQGFGNAAQTGLEPRPVAQV